MSNGRSIIQRDAPSGAEQEEEKNRIVFYDKVARFRRKREARQRQKLTKSPASIAECVTFSLHAEVFRPPPRRMTQTHRTHEEIWIIALLCLMCLTRYTDRFGRMKKRRAKRKNEQRRVEESSGPFPPPRPPPQNTIGEQLFLLLLFRPARA